MADHELLNAMARAYWEHAAKADYDTLPEKLKQHYRNASAAALEVLSSQSDEEPEMKIEDRIQHYRKRWSEQFGGGMLPFDNVYFDACRQGSTNAEAQRLGMNALLDEFVMGLCAELSPPAQGGRND